MPLPFLLPLILGGTIGAITNKEDPLKGALMGGILGAFTGGLGGAAAPAAGASQGALSAATTATATGAPTAGAALSAAATPVATSTAASPLVTNSMKQALSKSLGENSMQSLTNASTNILTAGGTMSPAAAGINSGIVSAGKAPLYAKALQVAKDKPMETYQFASALGGPQEQEQPMLQTAPIVQPQRAPVRSVQETLSTASGDSPTFIPRGLFEESMGELEEDRLNRMQY